MSIFKKSITKSLVFANLVVLASASLGDVTPEEAWAYIIKRTEIADFNISASTSIYKDKLIVSNPVLSMRNNKYGFSIVYYSDDWRLIQQKDGSVKFEGLEDGLWRINFYEAGNQPIVVELIQSIDHSNYILSRENDQIREDFSFGEIQLNFVQLEQGSSRVAKDMLQLSFIIKDMKGSMVDHATFIDNTDININLGAISVDMKVEVIEEGFGASLRSIFSGVEYSGTSQIPRGVTNKINDESFALGRSDAAVLKYNTGNTQILYTGSERKFTLNSTSKNGSMLSDTSEVGVNLRSDMLEWDVSMNGSSLPSPVGFSLNHLTYGATLPIVASLEEQGFSLKFELEGLDLSPTIWDIFDPMEVFARGKFTVKLDMQGFVRILKDYVLFEMEELNDFPEYVEFLSIALNEFVVSGLGTKISAEGALAFDSEDYQTFSGIPRPSGSMRLRLRGMDELLNKIGKLGSFSSEEIMGARMLMGMLSVPIGRGEVEADLRIDNVGSIYANGQRIK